MWNDAWCPRSQFGDQSIDRKAQTGSARPRWDPGDPALGRGGAVRWTKKEMLQQVEEKP